MAAGQDSVAEDYRPFDVNVTTDRAVFDSYPLNRRAMLVLTPSNEWYGSAGGVAYVDVYGSSSFDAPGWVFTVIHHWCSAPSSSCVHSTLHATEQV